VVLDVFSRRIVGWAMSSHLYTELMLRALDMALQQRRTKGICLRCARNSVNCGRPRSRSGKCFNCSNTYRRRNCVTALEYRCSSGLDVCG
jgi:hypothetical protein